MTATEPAAPMRARAMWHIYEWPGGRWLVTPWTMVPGAKEAHGPLLWEPTIEAARARLPEGLKRFDPTPDDRERNPALAEIWL